MRPLAPSTALMSNEKLVPVVTPGTPITFTNPGVELEPPPPPQAHRIRLASTAKPNVAYRIIVCSSLLLPLALIVRTGNTERPTAGSRPGALDRTRGCYRFAD